MYGAERVVVILLDNGRSEAREECLWCIGCGNCIVNCPVYNVSIPTNDIIEKMRKSSQLRPKAHEKISKSVIEKDSPY